MYSQKPGSHVSTQDLCIRIGKIESGLEQLGISVSELTEQQRRVLIRYAEEVELSSAWCIGALSTAWGRSTDTLKGVTWADFSSTIPHWVDVPLF